MIVSSVLGFWSWPRAESWPLCCPSTRSRVGAPGPSMYLLSCWSSSLEWARGTCRWVQDMLNTFLVDKRGLDCPGCTGVPNALAWSLSCTAFRQGRVEVSSWQRCWHGPLWGVGSELGCLSPRLCVLCCLFWKASDFRWQKGPFESQQIRR